MKGMGPIPRGFEAGPDGRLLIGEHDFAAQLQPGYPK